MFYLPIWSECNSFPFWICQINKAMSWLNLQLIQPFDLKFDINQGITDKKFYKGIFCSLHSEIQSATNLKFSLVHNSHQMFKIFVLD